MAAISGDGSSTSRAYLRGSQLNVVETPGPEGYALLDCGNGRKLEQFGPVIVDRPERQALWPPALPRERWTDAHAVFSASNDDDEKGTWRFDRKVPEAWPLKVPGAQVSLRLQGLWHVGVFPEQAAHWAWMLQRIAAHKGGEPVRVLNLFGYTGAASLSAAAAGAHVTHVDASKKAVTWARENQTASGLQDKPIRWIVDDAAKFTAREVRRGRSYDVILVDPPKFGRGPNKEIWDLFDDLPDLLRDCAKLASSPGASMVLTVYAIRASALAFEQLARVHFGQEGAMFDTGELLLVPRGQGPGVPTSLFVRWQGRDAR